MSSAPTPDGPSIEPSPTPRPPAPPRRLTVADIARLYAEGRRIAMVTAYDYPTARILDEAGIPIIFVGDSVGRVILGYENEVRVTMAEMLHHVKAVARGTRRALLLADMPFLTYGVSIEESVANAGQLIQEGGAQAVKLEGGERSARTIQAIVRAGIPVMAHIGLTPQSVNQLGGYKVQGKTRDSARRVLDDARAVQEAGAFAVLLELVPAQLAASITDRLAVPTIGIGAGPGCAGQVQVVTDLLGLEAAEPLRHVRRYANLHDVILDAVRAFQEDVIAGTFPGPDQATQMDESILDAVLGRSDLDRTVSGSASASGASSGGIPLDRDL